jgi:two-component system cell cycle response regulator
VNELIMRPIARHELLARARTQTTRQRYAVALPPSVTNTLALAVTDELTGLYNRRYFDRHLSIMLEKAREQGRDMAVMLIDMDFFKSVNDNHGHDIGDAVLKEFAQRLRRNIRGVDLACRFGGEEFVVLMPDTDWRQAQGVAERVRQAVAEKGFATGSGRPLSLTVSVGLALNESETDTPEIMLKRADVALYRAKREGRNRVVFDAA